MELAIGGALEGWGHDRFLRAPSLPPEGGVPVGCGTPPSGGSVEFCPAPSKGERVGRAGSEGAPSWDRILRVRHVDPLRCAVWQNPERVIGVIDDPRVVEKILRHLGAWHDPAADPSPPGAPGPYTYKPCDDADPHPGLREWADRLSAAGWPGLDLGRTASPAYLV